MLKTLKFVKLAIEKKNFGLPRVNSNKNGKVDYKKYILKILNFNLLLISILTIINDENVLD